MTPDTAALRALANGVSRLGAPQEFTSEEDFAGLGMGRAERRYYAAVTPDTVRALCDAADEVERLRANGNGYLQRAHAAEAVVERLRCVHCGEVGCDWIGDIRKARAEMAEAERDAARDEVERLREDVEALHGLLSAGAIGTAPGSDSHRMVLAMRDHYKRQRDASRAAHAALVAGIETGLRESACAECDHDRCATYRSAASWVRDYAALDRHAPTLTTTED